MIYLLRHGLDDESYVGGWSDVDLVEEGKQQVNDIIETISKLNIKKIYSSDIKRAVSTANMISAKLNIPIELSEYLREQNKGDANGLKKDTTYSMYKEYLESNDINKRYPNGECLNDLFERVRDNMHLLEELDDVLLVTHRGVINMLYYILNDIPLDMKKKRFGVTHASLHELDLKNRTIRRVE